MWQSFSGQTVRVICASGVAIRDGEGRQEVPFLKKSDPKNISPWARALRQAGAKRTEVFCFFFSKKKILSFCP
jgi:hypothetical protein